jgi:hypothetical protein
MMPPGPDRGDNVSLHHVQAGRDITVVIGDYHPPPPTLTALHQLRRPVDDFTGRTTELEELFSITKQRGVTICGIQGVGGIGKTELAIKLAERLMPQYTDAQFYLDLKGTSAHPVSASDAMAQVIRAYHPHVRLPDNMEELRGYYLSVLYGQKAIVFMDNAANRSFRHRVAYS